MKKRTAILAVCFVGAVFVAGGAAQAAPPTPAVATGALVFTGCHASCGTVIGVLGGEDTAGWCVDEAGLCTITGGSSHEWHSTDTAGSGSLTGSALGGGTLTISVGGDTFTLAVGTGGVINDGTNSSHGVTWHAVGAVEFTTGTGAVALVGL